MKCIQGDRIGRQGKLAVGCCAVVFDTERKNVLLTRRADNGRWVLPGGHMEPGESVEEACLRECEEETGLKVRAKRLIGVYSSPHRLFEYADGRRTQFVMLCFECEVIGGALTLTNETTEYGYFSPDSLGDMDIMEHHKERIADAFAGAATPFIR